MVPHLAPPACVSLPRLGTAVGAALLTAAVATGPAWALASPAAAETPTYPKELQDSLRQALTELQASWLSDARVSPRGMRVFQQAMQRGLAKVPIETLVEVQISMQISMPISSGRPARSRISR